MQLFQAHQQWATRPDDERFPSLAALYAATKAYADTAREREAVPIRSLRVENVDGNVNLIGRGNIPATLTHWAFGQLCARIGAPAFYLRSLPATLACQNLNHGLAQRTTNAPDATVNLLFHVNSGFLLRALTSERYERIWNWEVAEQLLDLQTRGWTPALPDVRSELDPNGPRPALYASDHDLFAFICHNDRVIRESGNPSGGLKRGLIAENSEVGASKIRLTRFLYREMCGNHIIWDAEHVIELSTRHVGNVRDRVARWEASILKYLDESPTDQEATIERAKQTIIAATKEDVLNTLFGRRTLNLSRKALEHGYEAVQPDQDGDPRSVWGIVQGLTRSSQATTYTDERTRLDKAAGKLMEAF